MTAVELGVATVKELCDRVGLDASSGIIDEVLFGQVLQAGCGQNPARQVALGAGLPVNRGDNHQQSLRQFIGSGNDGGKQHYCR